MRANFYFVLILTVFLLKPFYVFADTEENIADKEIASLYIALAQKNNLNLEQRLNFISSTFIDRPYYLTALGEGDKGIYDQFPLYRVDVFDCQSYVETVLALTLAKNLPDFKTYIQKIRYRDGKISYSHRNHFPTIDWNPNNQKQNFTKDITTSFHNANGDKIYKIATAVIDKPSFYKHREKKNLRLVDAKNTDLDELLNALHNEGEQFVSVKGQLPYIPISVLFSALGEANYDIFNQIPHGAIIEIVRPNWDITSAIGTNQNVSHMGFVFRENNELIFRDGSYLKGKVSNTPLVEYLKKYIDHSSIKGINIQVVMPNNKRATSD